MTVHSLACRSCFLIFLTLPLAAQEAAGESTDAAGVSLFGLVVQGGWAMYPLGLLMLATFYLTFHCAAQTRQKYFLPADMETLGEALGRGDIEGVRRQLRNASSVLGRLMMLSLEKARPARADANREAMEAAFVEGAEGEENAISQWVNYLNVIATVAPMVGLLGTVSGMIGAFQKIGQGGMGKPEELADNIGEALITTATGLVIGIPAMMAYFYFRNRLTSRMITIGQTGGRLMDRLEGHAMATTGIPAPADSGAPSPNPPADSPL